MPDLYLLVDLFVSISLLALGLTVLLKNSRLEINRIFFVFVVFVVIWIVANYISNDINNSPHTAVVANYFVFFFSYSSAIYLLRFSISIANDVKARRVLKKASIPLTLIGLTAFTPLVVQGVHLQTQVYAVQFGPLTPLYGVTLIGINAMTLWLLRKNIRKTDGHRQEAQQVLYRSLYITFPLLLMAQFIIPAITGWFGLTNIGILSMLIIVYGLYYGVIKHKLFDLKLIVARSLAYVLSLGSLGALFVLLTFVLTGTIFHGKNLNITDLRWIYGILVLVLALAYDPLKKFFDSKTRYLFFRDAYDSQEFLDDFNKLLVATYELEPLLRKSAQLIEERLKPDYVVFGLKETASAKRRIIGTSGHPTFSEEHISTLRAVTPKMKTKLIITDLLDEKYIEIQRILSANDIAMIGRLAASTYEEGIGYLVLGLKKSGNSYNSQDIKVIEIITNELVIAIQNALRTEEIENFNITLQARVNEATRKLRRTNEKLKIMDETKDDFISMASHQLRTPLTSVKGYISMVLEEDAGKINKTQRDMLGQAFFSSQRMVYLIADLLNVSRLKTGKFVIERSLVQLDQIVEQELRQLQQTASARNLTLQYDKPDNFPPMMLDETKTRQIIMNFVDNAIYYTPSGGHIIVRLIDNENSVELRVEDNGIGVPKAEQPHLFTKFYRAGNARQARPDGTGLGLFMAKKVIVSQGGSIIFDSIEGKGSTFGFIFSKNLAVGTPVAPTVSSVPVAPVK